MKLISVFALLTLLLCSCKKIDWPWETSPTHDSKLDTNTIVATMNGLIDGYRSDSTAFSNGFSFELRKSGYINTSVYNRSPVGQGDAFAYLGSDIRDRLSPFKSKNGKNIAITGGVSGELAQDRTQDSHPLSELRKYCLALKDSGWTVYVLTNPYQNPAFNDVGVGHGGYATNTGYDSTEFLERIKALNDSVRQEYKSYADGLIDIAANPRFAQFDSTFYQLNHYYFTEVGIDSIAKMVFEGLKPELNSK